MSNHGADAEFAAIQLAFESLEALDEDAQIRALTYIADRLGIDIKPGFSTRRSSVPEEGEADNAAQQEVARAPKFESFAELADVTQAKTHAEKALVAGYWLQVCQEGDSFDGFSANRELKNLGEGVSNITVALDTLRNQKPALALQLKKSGRSQQARKVYKLTIAGIKSVESMIENGGQSEIHGRGRA